MQNNSGAAILEEAKVLFVAASRARKKLYTLERTGIPIIDRRIMPSGFKRYVTSFNKSGFLVQAGLPIDIDKTSFVSKALFPSSKEATIIQNIIWKMLKPGTPLMLVPRKKFNQIELIICYYRPGSDKPIPLGLMSQEFVTDLDWLLRKYSSDRSAQFSPTMSGLSVFERQTIVLPPYPKNVPETICFFRFLSRNWNTRFSRKSSKVIRSGSFFEYYFKQ